MQGLALWLTRWFRFFKIRETCIFEFMQNLLFESDSNGLACFHKVTVLSFLADTDTSLKFEKLERETTP